MTGSVWVFIVLVAGTQTQFSSFHLLYDTKSDCEKALKFFKKNIVVQCFRMPVKRKIVYYDIKRTD